MTPSTQALYHPSPTAPCLLLSLIEQDYDNPADQDLWGSMQELADDYPVLYSAHQVTWSPWMLTLHLDVESFGELLGAVERGDLTSGPHTWLHPTPGGLVAVARWCVLAGGVEAICCYPVGVA